MANYPTSASTDANLYVQVNNKSTTLSDNPLTSGATTVNVASTTGFPTAGYITIDAEAISYTGVTGTSFTTCTRGADGTTATSHTTGTNVFHNVVAQHHNGLKDEVKAVESDLVNLQSAITPVTATSTATSALNRIAMVVNQIKVGFGLTNWYDTVSVSATKAYVDSKAGLIKQIVTATGTTNTSTTSSTLTTTVVTASITPSAITSKVRIQMFFTPTTANGTNSGTAWTIKNGSTNLAGGTQSMGFLDVGSAVRITVSQTQVWVDSPASTSAQTYTLFIASQDNTTSVGCNNGGVWYVILEEVLQ